MLPTSAIWTLLIVSNLISFWGAIRWKGRSTSQERRFGLAAIGFGGVLEIAAVVLLVLRYSRHI